MVKGLFQKEVCVKKWMGAADKKAAARRSMAGIPKTDFLIAASAGDLFDPETMQLIDKFDVAANVVDLIIERNWDELSFDDLATALTDMHQNLNNHIKKCLAESEIFLMQIRNGLHKEKETTRQNKSPVTVPKKPALI